MIQLKSISAELHWNCSKATDFLPTQKINTFFLILSEKILPFDIMKAFFVDANLYQDTCIKIAIISMSFLPLFKFFIMIESIMSLTDASINTKLQSYLYISSSISRYYYSDSWVQVKCITADLSLFCV